MIDVKTSLSLTAEGHEFVEAMQGRAVAVAMPDKTKELHAKMLAWREVVNAPMPTPNKEATELMQKKSPRKAK